jgi:hypothetical protein
VWNPLELSAPSGLESCGLFSRHFVKQRKVNPIASVPILETCMIWIHTTPRRCVGRPRAPLKKMQIGKSIG